MAMTTGREAGDDVMVDINTTSLIDVMLVLLIMLIITIPVQTHALKLQMPVSETSVRPPPAAVRIELAADGAIRWNGEPLVDRAALQARLAALAAQADPPPLHLRPDRHVAYKHLAAVLAAAQHAGLTRIGIAGNEAIAP